MNEAFMRRAIEISIDNARSARGGPFGAIVVKADKIISEGTNRVTATNDPTAHAEVVAIRTACAKLGLFQLRGFDLYTSCEPCPMCLGAIYWTRPDHVYYAGTAADASRVGFDDAFIYREIPLPPSQRKIPMVQLLHDEAQEAFRIWEHQPNKIPY
jgi:tRNA(Arg) A34 adenosine deaminase TadA